MTTFSTRSELPVFGKNFNAGWSFGSFRDDNLTSKGILWFTRYDQMDTLPVSHVGIVESETTVIEAVAGKGVIRTPLSNYFDDPHVHIYFRKPKPWSLMLAQQIVAVAQTQLGHEYDDNLIKAHLAAGSMSGHVLDFLTDGKFESWLCKMMDSPEKWICSELAAWIMQRIPSYAGRGCLEKPACTITPPEYIWNHFLFDNYKRDDYKKE